MTTVSVILPTYNEKDNITPLVEAVLRSSQHPTSVWVVDDDSPDGTWQRVAEMASHDPRVHLIHRTDAKGLTSAIARGIRDSDGDIVVWMDCDFSMPPERIPALVNAIVRESADIAVGSRYVAGGADVGHSLMAQAFSRTINLAAGLLFGFGVHDYTSGFIAARRVVFERIELTGDYGEYCIDLLVRSQRQGWRVVEVPYLCVERQSGQSKTGVNAMDYIRRGRHYVTTIGRLALHHRP
ncbi:MAG: polyprenol monophosphomannose synthase [Anaerolineae bacterium]|uniref:polyprenol monophosphomannose synthase n=1 Tax=Candidatus Amarolinea dominans TaxID=3140696 RepID=UPI00313588BC|nr:polyprenol monophosphomannose synthase [Anaerolineae bacterium]MBK9230462.1 polyprenol monophosphomannose synthase [Anaerolineae bacterium]